MKKHTFLAATLACLLALSGRAEAHGPGNHHRHAPQKQVTVLHKSPVLTVRHIQYTWPSFSAPPVRVVHYGGGHRGRHWNHHRARPVWHAGHHQHRGWHHCPR